MTKTENNIIENFELFEDWEDKYTYIIEMGKTLPKFPESERKEINLVRGCQSQVWLYITECENIYNIYIDSDSQIVKGLGGIIWSIYNNKTKSEIKNFDIENFLNQIGLMEIITPTRGNGLKKMIEKIKNI